MKYEVSERVYERYKCVGYKNIKLYDNIDDAVKDFDNRGNMKNIKTLDDRICNICGKSNKYTLSNAKMYKKDSYIHGGPNGIIWVYDDICQDCKQKICKHVNCYYSAGISAVLNKDGSFICGKTMFCSDCILNLGICKMDDIPKQVFDDCIKGGYI